MREFKQRPDVMIVRTRATLVPATRFAGFADTSLRPAAVIVTTPAVTIVVAATDDAIAIIAPTLEVPPVAIAAAAQITVKVRRSVDIRPAVGRAIEIRKAIRAIAKLPASFSGTPNIGPPLQSRLEFPARSWPWLEFRSAAGWRFRTAIRAAIEVRSAAPAIAVVIKVTVAVVTIPIAAEAEDNDGNTERAIILRTDINAALLIKRLDISAVHPATAVIELHVAPRHVGKTTVDLNGFAGRNHGDRRICCAWAGAHIDVCRREAFCRLSDRRSKQEHTGRGNFQKGAFHVFNSLGGRRHATSGV
ncbi:hypothetical protein ABIE78_003943 [Sinorhizobium fredii]